MIRLPASLRRLTADESGSYAVEFALIAPVFALTVMGLFDLGYSMYVSSQLQGALHDAARLATVGTMTGDQIDARVRQQLAPFSRDTGTVTLTTLSYTSFADVKMPEKITSDTAPMGQYNVGDCYEDANNNGRYDMDRGRTGLGQAEDIVNYTVSITYPRLFPMYSLAGWSQNQTITGSTVLRNQPYAARNTGITVRCN